MTENKSFKRRVRERMDKTDESYTAARRQVVEKRDRTKGAEQRLAAAADRPSDESIRRATGRDWDEWFTLLDAWDATAKKHADVARYVHEEHGVDGWWAQSVTVAYERARGLRLKHQRPGGFEVSASKTVAVPVERLFAALVDDAQRERWLGSATMSLRTAQPARTARFDWGDGSTRVNASFQAKSADKSVVTVVHERLPDADDAETMKAMWRERLTDLKSLLES